MRSGFAVLGGEPAENVDQAPRHALAGQLRQFAFDRGEPQRDAARETAGQHRVRAEAPFERSGIEPRDVARIERDRARRAARARHHPRDLAEDIAAIADAHDRFGTARVRAHDLEAPALDDVHAIRGVERRVDEFAARDARAFGIGEQPVAHVRREFEHVHRARPPRSALPGRAPVGRPPLTTALPLTHTPSMPSGYA